MTNEFAQLVFTINVASSDVETYFSHHPLTTLGIIPSTITTTDITYYHHVGYYRMDNSYTHPTTVNIIYLILFFLLILV